MRGDRRRPRPRPAARLRLPYALETLLDELTLAPIVLRDGEPVEIEPLSDGGEVDFGEPIGAGADDLHAALGAADLRRELRLRASAASGSRCSPPPLERLRALAAAPARRGRGGRGSEAVPQSQTHRLGPHRRGARPASGARGCAPSPRRHESWGLGRRHRLDRLAGRRGRAAAGPRARSRRAARCRLSAASTRRRCSPSCETRGGDAGVRARSERRGGGRRVKVGVAKEIKQDEYRVAITPAGVREMVEHGHEVLIEAGRRRGLARSPTTSSQAQGARSRPGGGRGLRRGGDDPPRQGAAADGDRDAAPGPAPVHLPAPGAGPRADRGRSASRARPASPTRRSRTSTAACRCWRR